ncbi:MULTISPECIES: 3-hydroxybutyrate dehydrogenase [Geobacillus]|uniref:3-hydroxybutyrate dehydrogenase n=1 Tax=Geobacillus thermoleovorans TaxID=33941 RepID=A0A1C3D5D6_GEOTH|nr:MULTISPECIES: 3-hydroxybutyrate dehydrogenase [Geobacillus]AOL34773.1 3-hydroxybutyrate dehydrogenase [Geobacillus thermoleovorans]AWO75818.1 3-hydroxybutyrate dehydrogenase [Geobacillus thermoleovorans]MBW7642778.1 3-hydroxybutyrate dehydrogenase [Geobacillus thermoleovorans]ODA16315.1 3-hydroxybutyrate dehydrogenase [Geobacillus thermoleovorans]OQP12692.1 3-hydroxybutyrate dehydrogenase [Geobacillus thermoleovorans]
MMAHRTALVTGAARGIGYEVAKTLATNGVNVVLADLKQEEVEQAAESLRQLGCEAVGVKCDVTAEEEVKQTIHEAVKRWERLDIVVNNAGLQYVANIEDFPTEKFEQLIRVMLVGPFLAIKHAFPLMKEQRYGRIINMASINGLIGFAGKAAYNSAKHGVIGLTKVAALEGAPYGITVNALCPGYVDTELVRNQLADLAATRKVPLEKVLEEVIYPLVPQRQLLSVEEVAHYVLFLAGEQAKGITGQAVVIDGGYTAQ